MYLVAATVAAATLAGSVNLRALIVRDHFLQVVIVTEASVPVLLTPRTSLGCYIEVEIQDPNGQKVGWFGPRATCATPSLSEYVMLWNQLDMGAQLFGVEIDVSTPGRVRLVSADGEAGKLDPGREYRLVVTHHNDDAKLLTSRGKRNLRRRYGEFLAPVIDLRSEPIPFRAPS